MVGADPASDGLERARRRGIPRLPWTDRASVIQGYAGVYSSCCTRSAPPNATACPRTRSCSGSVRPATSAVRKT